jgi:predicted DNA-binding ribbon-helix-helix protein
MFKLAFRSDDFQFFKSQSAKAVKRMKSGNTELADLRAVAWQTPEAGEINKRSVVIAGHRTSISVENAFWHALLVVARARGVSANKLITGIDRERSGNLSSAIRLFVLAEIMKAADRATE